MKFSDVIIVSVILCVFSTVSGGAYSSIKKMDCRIEELRHRTTALSFISESFYKTCEGKGFSSLDEWKTVCRSLWQLDSIEWDYLSADRKVIYGVWAGSSCEGKVYCRSKDE